MSIFVRRVMKISLSAIIRGLQGFQAYNRTCQILKLSHTKDTYGEPRHPLNVHCYMNDRVSVNVEEYSPFRPYVITLWPLEHLRLSIHGKYTTGREDTPSILPRK